MPNPTAHWDFSNETLVDTVSGAVMTVSRNVTTSCRNSSGQLELVAVDQPAFHYAYDGTFVGLQIFCGGNTLRSPDAEDLTNASWFKLNATVGANAITDPYGNATSADTITDANDAVTKGCYARCTATCSANDPMEMSAFVKVETLGTGNNYFYMDPGSFSGVVGGIVWDLEDPLGAPVLVEVDVDQYGVEQFAGGWYRFWMVFGVETDTGGSFYYGLANTATAQGTYPHDGRSIGLWGVCARQLDGSASTTPLSGPVPYANNNMLRDNLECADLSPFFSNLDPILGYYQDFELLCDPKPNQTRYSLHLDCTSDANSYIELYYGVTTTGVNVQNSSSLDSSGTTTDVWQSASVNRTAMCITDDDIRITTNGGAVTQTAGCTYPLDSNIASANWDWWFGGNRPIDGYYKNIVFYNENLTDAELLDLTTNGLSTSFPGNVAGDGGHIWPPRANDPRWTQMISDSGITATGNFMDDVKAALIALSGASGGSLDDLWKKTKTANSVTDTSEPYLY